MCKRAEIFINEIYNTATFHTKNTNDLNETTFVTKSLTPDKLKLRAW